MSWLPSSEESERRAVTPVRAQSAPAEEVLRSMVEQIAARIEPITRFDASSLSTRPGRAYDVRADARDRSTVAFITVERSGKGRAPQTATQCGSETDMHRAASHALSNARAGLRDRLAMWVALIGDAERPPSSVDCYDGPDAFAHTFTCGTCNGSGTCTCGGCGGRGNMTCPTCYGSARRRCSRCNGGQISCSSCGGSGGRNTTDGRGQTVWQQCYSCGGRKSTMCSMCRGSAQVQCDWCIGSGRVKCSTCGGGGRVNCGTCGATGKLHSVVSVECHVSSAYAVAVDSADADVIRRLSTGAVTPLRALARVTELHPDVGADYVERRYTIAATFSELHVNAGSTSVRLLGLGPAGNIDHFGGIADELLKGDLEALRDACRTQSRVAVVPSHSLCHAMNVFTQSEVHVTIAKALAGPLQSANAIASKLNWVVSEHYAADASAVLGVAVRRAFRTALVVTALGAALVGPVAGEIIRRSVPIIDPWVTLGIMVLASVAAVIGAEWVTLRQIGRRFDADVWARLQSLIRHFRIRWTSRAVALAVPIVYGIAVLGSAPVSATVSPRRAELARTTAVPRAPRAASPVEAARLAQVFGSILGLGVSAPTHSAVVTAIATAGAVIASDRVIDRDGMRIMVSSGAAFRIPGLREVRCVFMNDHLVSFTISRTIDAGSGATATQRAAVLARSFRLTARDATSASFSGQGLLVRLYETRGQLVEFYQMASAPLI